MLCFSSLSYFVTYIVFILIVYTCNLASGCQVSMFFNVDNKIILFYSILNAFVGIGGDVFSAVEYST